MTATTTHPPATSTSPTPVRATADTAEPAVTGATSRPTTDPAREEQTARRLRAGAIAVLVPVAVVGAVLSFDGLHSRARGVFTDPLAYGFPLLVDALILGCTLAYLAGAKVGRPRAGWRLAAHAGIAGTVALNAAAATSWAEVPWHITAPIVWSVLVELTGKELLGEWHAHHQPVRASIPARLWLTAPAESLRTWLRIARRLDGEQTAARLDVGVHAAAVHALALAVPGWRNRKVRRILRRQLRAGSLSPLAILGPLGWTDDTTATLARIDGPAVLRAALRDAIRAATTPVTATPGPAQPAPQVPAVAVSVSGSHAPMDAVYGDEVGDDDGGAKEDDTEDTSAVDDAHARLEGESEEARQLWLDEDDPYIDHETPGVRDDNGQTYDEYMDATYGQRSAPHYMPNDADTVDVRVSADKAARVRDDEDGPDNDGPGPRGGGAPAPRVPAATGPSGAGDVLTAAVQLVQSDPQLTGAQMAARMAALGHTGRGGQPVSDRTGRRWISDAMSAIETQRRDRLQVVGGQR